VISNSKYNDSYNYRDNPENIFLQHYQKVVNLKLMYLTVFVLTFCVIFTYWNVPGQPLAAVIFWTFVSAIILFNLLLVIYAVVYILFVEERVKKERND
jgi:membrane protein implicated in regulation of membrane protease activity